MKENRKNLRSITKKFLRYMFRSSDRIPEGIRFICYANSIHVPKRFPNSKYSAIGGTLLLRFIAPGILTPQQSGIMEGDLPQEAKRTLVLISKILQVFCFKLYSLEEFSKWSKVWEERRIHEAL